MRQRSVRLMAGDCGQPRAAWTLQLPQASAPRSWGAWSCASEEFPCPSPGRTCLAFPFYRNMSVSLGCVSSGGDLWLSLLTETCLGDSVENSSVRWESWLSPLTETCFTDSPGHVSASGKLQLSCLKETYSGEFPKHVSVSREHVTHCSSLCGSIGSLCFSQWNRLAVEGHILPQLICFIWWHFIISLSFPEKWRGNKWMYA